MKHALVIAGAVLACLWVAHVELALRSLNHGLGALVVSPSGIVVLPSQVIAAQQQPPPGDAR